MIWINDTLVSQGDAGVYGERVINGYRVWDPYRSKLAALYALGAGPDLIKSMRVLYLGAAHGTTVSHVADYTDVVYAVEFAPRPIQDLLEVSARRRNVIPIMADASRPQTYAPLIEYVDLIYQDIAQPDQVEIARRNWLFLKDGGIAVLILKTRCVDVKKSPKEVLATATIECEDCGIRVLKSTWLSPYHQDHVALLCTKT
ncbi:MAG: fibrillarin-like rRNA/tRNA 2'-O-methyltransferase [Methanoregulaceae archaeon]|nr:fibrillarin-like rRNA/tRNA 2'-O-methyltransferase [Methanoregulaceae archaeon]